MICIICEQSFETSNKLKQICNPCRPEYNRRKKKKWIAANRDKHLAQKRASAARSRLTNPPPKVNFSKLRQCDDCSVMMRKRGQARWCVRCRVKHYAARSRLTSDRWREENSDRYRMIIKRSYIKNQEKKLEFAKKTYEKLKSDPLKYAEHRAKRSKRSNDRYHNDPEVRFREKARYKVAYAIKTGAVVRPDSCSGCGVVGKPQAHHYKGYEQEHWFDIKWLCRKCHGYEHRLYR